VRVGSAIFVYNSGFGMSGNEVEQSRSRLANSHFPLPASPGRVSRGAPVAVRQLIMGDSRPRASRLMPHRASVAERLTELLIRALAFSAVAAMIVILIFIAKTCKSLADRSPPSSVHPDAASRRFCGHSTE
jgi:hypothetical protein